MLRAINIYKVLMTLVDNKLFIKRAHSFLNDAHITTIWFIIITVVRITSQRDINIKCNHMRTIHTHIYPVNSLSLIASSLTAVCNGAVGFCTIESLVLSSYYRVNHVSLLLDQQ